LEEGVYWIACSEAQQAAELYLRGLHVALAGLHPLIHDLVELLDSLGDLDLEPPDDLYVYADALTPFRPAGASGTFMLVRDFLAPSRRRISRPGPSGRTGTPHIPLG